MRPTPRQIATALFHAAYPQFKPNHVDIYGSAQHVVLDTLDGQPVLALMREEGVTVFGYHADGRLVGRGFYEQDRVQPGRIDDLRRALPEFVRAANVDQGWLTEEREGSFGQVIVQGGLAMTLRMLGLQELSSVAKLRWDPRAEPFLPLAERIDVEAIEALMGAHDFTVADFAWVSASPARKALCRALPSVAKHLLPQKQLVERLMAAGASESEIVLEAMAAEGSVPAGYLSGPRARAALLAALDATKGVADEHFQGLQTALEINVPFERLPRSRDEWTAFSCLYELASGLTTDHDEKIRLMDIPGGRYAETFAKIRKLPIGRGYFGESWPLEPGRSYNVLGLMMFQGDTIHRVVDLLILPIALHEGLNPDRGSLSRIAEELMFRDMSLLRRLGALDSFHVENAPIAQALTDICSRKKISWIPPMARDKFQVNKLQAVWLRTPRDLLDEGRDGPDAKGMMGLKHCVATYIFDCMSGDAHMLSLRSRDAQGKWQRRSTLEFRLDKEEGRLVCVQHRGYENGDPPPEAADAVERLEEILGDPRTIWPVLKLGGQVFAPPGVEVRGGTPKGIVSGANDIGIMLKGFESWLPRNLRGLGPAEFAAAIRLAERACAQDDPDEEPNMAM